MSSPDQQHDYDQEKGLRDAVEALKAQAVTKILAISSATTEIEGTILSEAARMAEKLQNKRTRSKRVKKDPNAPKRFKSSYIFFAERKYKEFAKELATEGIRNKTTPQITKMVSVAWRALENDERSVFEDMSAKDKQRFEIEKLLYKGSWTVPINHKRTKDAAAPRRPRSAFLAFSNCKRLDIKKAMPEASNGDISKILSKMWKDAPPELKGRYQEEERKLRGVYTVEVGKWRESEDARLQQRQDEAMRLAELGVSLPRPPPVEGVEHIYLALSGNKKHKKGDASSAPAPFVIPAASSTIPPQGYNYQPYFGMGNQSTHGFLAPGQQWLPTLGLAHQAGNSAISYRMRAEQFGTGHFLYPPSSWAGGGGLGKLQGGVPTWPLRTGHQSNFAGLAFQNENAILNAHLHRTMLSEESAPLRNNNPTPNLESSLSAPSQGMMMQQQAPSQGTMMRQRDGGAASTFGAEKHLPPWRTDNNAHALLGERNGMSAENNSYLPQSFSHSSSRPPSDQRTGLGNSHSSCTAAVGVSDTDSRSWTFPGGQELATSSDLRRTAGTPHSHLPTLASSLLALSRKRSHSSTTSGTTPVPSDAPSSSSVSGY